jgi:hypothetical protein
LISQKASHQGVGSTIANRREKCRVMDRKIQVEDQSVKNRDSELATCIQNLKGVVGEQMQELSQSRTWRDGFALEAEHERYQEMLHELELLTARWEIAENDKQRWRIAEELDRAGLEELRSFIRSHEQAQFLF